MTGNSLVDFLATYGPTPAGQSMYDEHVLQGSAHFNVAPLSIDSGKVGDIVSALAATEPRSVILTGTAGDGKTWHCRKVYVALGGTEEAWRQSECRVELDLHTGRRLIIIKDLSQFDDSKDQDGIIGGFCESVSGRGEDVYLVAANDGRLLRALRRYSETHPEARGIEEAIRTMLKADEPRRPGLHFDMWNLSRQSHDRTFERLLDAVVDHEGWAHCEGCDNNMECPILRNRAILKSSGEVGIRARLRDIIRIAADNDMHLPIRQVLLLVVNTLLGVSGNRSPLMTCDDARSLQQNGRLAAANPYDNVFGINLGPAARNFRAFGILAGFGVGRETNNYIDALLLDNEPKDDHDRYVANDPIFGAALFEDIRKQYRRGDGVDYDDFRDAIERQRRRLFFVLPPTDRPAHNELDPWRLTVFMHAGEYLSFANLLKKGSVDQRVRNRLAIGLNRSYTGMMTDEGASLWFAAPTANAQSRIGQVLDIQVPVGKNPLMMVHFDFDAKGPHDAVRMVLHSGSESLVWHVLQPLLFEYLLRVEGGSLPGSFSRQCFEELRQFRLRVVATLGRRGLVDAEGVEGIRIVSLSTEGRLHADEIGLITGGAQ